MRYQTAPCPARPRPRIHPDYTFRTLPTGAGMIRRPPKTVKLGPSVSGAAPLGTATQPVLEDHALGGECIADPVRFAKVFVLAGIQPLAHQLLDRSVSGACGL